VLRPGCRSFNRELRAVDEVVAMKRIQLAVGAGILATILLPSLAQALLINGLTSEWVAISYPGANPDPYADQQTGQSEADIVGTASIPAIYTQYDDNGTPGDTSDDILAFRFRLAEERQPTGFSTAAIIGLNVFPDPLAASDPMDLYLVLNTSGSGDTIQLYDPGNKANISPNTTNTSAIAGTEVDTDALNYSWSPVSAVNCDGACALDTDFDLDGDGTETDYFLSFSFSYQMIIDELADNGITGVDENSAISYVFGTSTQVNSYNQDLGGIDDDVADMDQTWSELGVLSDPYTATGILVPEPSTGLLLAGGLAVLAYRGRARKQQRAGRS
jgi:hypothetical protein